MPPQNKEKITASMATMPSRLEVLESAVSSILPQVDRLNVYLNEFLDVPHFLDSEKIVVMRSQEFEDLSDAGKFYWVEEAEGYFFSIDDDIIYPSDYTQRMVQKIDFYEKKAIVGVHGVIFKEEIDRFYNSRKVFHFRKEEKKDLFVNLLGTGTTAFHSETIQLTRQDFPGKHMADIWLAIAAKKLGIPMVAISRFAEWLHPVIEDDKDSIFQRFYHDDLLQTMMVQEESPWPVLSM